MINPAEKVPTYVRIDSFVVEPTDLFRTGSIASDIKSVWVFFDNQSAGVYDLPANVPIIANGPGVVQLIPAVQFSGLNYVRQYPFYEADTFKINYLPGEVTHHTGRTRYRANAQFQWKEDFDLTNSFIKVNADRSEDAVLIRTELPEYAFEGKGTGLIRMNSTQPSCEIITSNDFAITAGETYLELNYKSTAPFEVALQTISPNTGEIVYRYVYGLNPTDGEWKKAYIGFTELVNEYRGKRYNLMLRSALPDGQADAYIALDNLKIISF